MHESTLSVIIPALDEAAYLTPTISALKDSLAASANHPIIAPEIIVVDNGSVDQTADVARALGATVVSEPVRNIGRARNAGARAASGEVLAFLDADTIVPTNFAQRLTDCMNDPRCIGGAFDTYHRPESRVLRAYFGGWRLVGLALGMAQGAAQFCRRGAFDSLGGYDERIFMGEDVDFYWRLKRLARASDSRVVYVRDVRVVPSPRRFDQWPVWKTILWTNPVVAGVLRRRRDVWRGWHEAPPR